ncbi:protein kinase family protein, partial [Xanthomonas citri pv. citri]|nr:protein kinase family protein [Xanthomonas citri pv. citri]
EFKKTNQPKEQLRSLIEGNPLLQKYKKALFSALNGDYQSADEMKKDMLDAGQKAAQRKQPIKASPQPATRQRQQKPRQG